MQFRLWFGAVAAWCTLAASAKRLMSSRQQFTQRVAVTSTADLSACDCTCCQITWRKPSYIVNNVEVMCAPPPPENPDYCGDQCYVDSTDVVITTAGGHKLEYGRFCFFECKPPSMDIGKQCSELDEEEQKSVMTKNGNPVDLATTDVDMPKVAPKAAAIGGGGGGGGGAGAGAGGPAKVDDLTAGAAGMAEDAAKEARAAATESRAAGAEAKSQKALSASKDAFYTSMKAYGKNIAAVADQQGLVMQAELHAKAADRARQIADGAVTAIRDAAKQAAMSAAAAAKAEMDVLAARSMNKAAAVRAKFSVPPGHVAGSAGAAAGPYNAAIARAAAIRDKYSLKAQTLASTAKQLQINAHIVAAQAQAYQATGHSGVASMLMGRARAAMGQVDGLMAEAEHWQASAADVQKKFPLYYEAAATAAARAAALDNPTQLGWRGGQHVPPPLPM